MGDFADMANERWADGDWEEDVEDEGHPGKTCRYCGTCCLSWRYFDKGWRLVDSEGKIHACDRKPTVERVF